MATHHNGDLPDVYANAIGAMIEYRTPVYKGFQFGLSGLFSFNTFSTDFSRDGVITTNAVPYELELFDLEDPFNKHDLDRLDELFISYKRGSSKISYGRQCVNTPLVNQRDTRMKPYSLQGLWLELNEWEPLKIQLGWFDRISPRSTVEWYKMEDAIGIFPQGFDAEGKEAHYHGKINTSGLGIAGLVLDVNPYIKVSAWDYLLASMLNTNLLQVDLKSSVNEKYVFGGLAYLGQQGLSNTAYLPKTHRSELYSLQFGWHTKKSTISAAFTHVTDKGMLLFPRELGRMQLYTTILRGRIEGLGDTDNLVLSFSHRLSDRMGCHVDVARFNTPSTDNYELNKYKKASSNQLNLGWDYHFKGILEGVDLQVLYTHKYAYEEDVQHDADALYYHADFQHISIISNIKF